MKNMTEIRWHGRGGQGAKTASLLLADAAFLSGQVVQSFPEYGPERSGAPITAYNRISDERCTIHSNIYEPDYVVVVDETLLDCRGCDRRSEEGGGHRHQLRASPPPSCVPCCRAMRARCAPSTRGKISEEAAGKQLPQHAHAGRHCEGHPACVEPEEFIAGYGGVLTSISSPASPR